MWVGGVCHGAYAVFRRVGMRARRVSSKLTQGALSFCVSTLGAHGGWHQSSFRGAAFAGFEASSLGCWFEDLNKWE